MDGKWVQRDDRPIFVPPNPFVRTLAQRGFGPTYKLVTTDTGRTMVPCDPVPPDCPHGQYKWNCADCGGNGKCIHNQTTARNMQGCDECGQSDKCIHKHRRYLCKECKGGGVCQHNRQKYYCKECRGAGICEHGLRKSSCSTCKTIPNERCEHGGIERCCEYCHPPIKAASLSEANLEAHDFRLEFAAAVVQSFPQKRKLSE